MRTLVLATLIGAVFAWTDSGSVLAQSSKSQKPDVEYCGMGECFPQYITSVTKDNSGLIIVHMRVEHYCLPGNACDPTVKEPSKTLISKV
jgi:hypothetical protein